LKERAMLESMIRFAIRRRLTVLLVTLALAAVGVWSFTRLPVDATPDITNVQVQVNTEAPGFSPQASTTHGRCRAMAFRR
jgi:cobalt-zinc-cadmium resistance protein CzcA